MWQYNFKLALRGLKHRVGLTTLMVITLGVGIGMLMTVVTISHQAKKIPMPHLADKLFMVKADSRDINDRDVNTFQRMVKLTWKDTMNLYRSDSPADSASFNFSVFPIVALADGSGRPIQARATATTGSFFSQFEAKFVYGQGWSEAQNGAPVIVLSKQANQKLFGGRDSVGEQVDVGTGKATVVGVLEDWSSQRRVFDSSMSISNFEDAYIPYQLALDLNMQRSSWMRCHPEDRPRQASFYQADKEGLLQSECAWVNYWVRIEDPDKVADYHQFLERYVNEQKGFGRFPREQQNYVHSIEQQISERDQGRWTRQIEQLAYLFFFVCLVNAVGMLLTKFLSTAKQVSLRRALGARKGVIMGQYLMEVLMIGAIGAVVGMILAVGGLTLMKYVQYFASDYNADLAVLDLAYQLDLPMIGAAIGVAIVSTLLVGLYPVWRIVNISPASGLKDL